MKTKLIANRKSLVIGMALLALFMISTMATGSFISTQNDKELERNQVARPVTSMNYKPPLDTQSLPMTSDVLSRISTERPIPDVNTRENSNTATQLDSSEFTWDSYQAMQSFYRDRLTTDYISEVQAKIEKERGMSFQKPLIDANLNKYFEPAIPPELQNQRTRLIIVIDESSPTKSAFSTERDNYIINSLTSHPTIKVLKTYQELPVIIAEANGKDIPTIAQVKGIKAIFEDHFIQVLDPNWKPEKTVSFIPQWYGSEASIGAFALHDLGVNGSGIKVAIIDTGIDKTHPDLDDFDNDPATNDPKVIAEASFVDFDGDGNPEVGPEDDFGHGTHVAGTVAASGNLIGMAPGAYLLNAKVLYYGGAMLSWIVNGVDWAMQQNADIISMSLGGWPGFPEPLLTSIVEAAWNQGIIVTISAGNSGPFANSVSSPGSASKVITVGASDVFNTTIFFSSRGFSPWGRVDPDVVAPGVEILSTLPDGGYGIASGTSMAAPHVAGAAALLLSANPNLSNEDVKRLLMATARDQDEDVNVQGAGRINVLKAYQEMNQHPRVLFPSGTLTLTLSPGENRTISIDLMSNESVTITPNLNGNMSSLLAWQTLPPTSSVGQTTLTFTITVPSDALSTDVFSGTLNFANFEGLLTFEVMVDEAQDDAGTGTDAGDIFIDATPLTLGNYSGMIEVGTFFDFEVDLYKVSLVKNRAYLMELVSEASTFFEDLDLLLFDENGTLIDFSAGFTTDEQIVHVANYTGVHYLMVYTFFAIQDAYYGLNFNEIQGAELPELAIVNLLGYSDAPVDEEGDGLADYLEINVTLEVSVDGTYDVLYVLAENRSDYQVGRYDVAFIWETVTLTAGTPTVVNTRIDGHVLRNTLYDGTYVIGEILIGDPSTFTVLLDEFNVHETASYQHDTFESLTYYLTGVTDSAVDTDGDGANDTMRITVDIYSQSSAIIDYIALPIVILGDWSGGFFVFISNDSVVLHSGTNAITFDISGDVLGQRDYNGTFIIPYLNFNDYDEIGDGSFRYSIWYETGYYETASLRQGGLTLTATSDQGVDTDSDGLIDYIEIKITFDVTKPATYQIIPASNYLINLEQQRVYFTDLKTPNATTWSYYSDLAVSFGEQVGRYVIIYRLPTAFLKERGANGTFLIPSFWVTKFRDDYWYSVVMTFNVKTQFYNSATFEDPKIQYLNKIWIEKTDAKFNDGVTDSIKVTLAFQVNTPGTYDLLLNILDHQTWGFWIYDAIVSKKTFSSTGEFNWTLLIDGKRLFLTKTELSLELLLLQVGTMAIDSDPYFDPRFDDLQVKAYSIALTPLYSWKEFEGAAPLSFTGVVKTTFVDNNSNGLYETVNVHFEVEVRHPISDDIMVDFGLTSANGSYSSHGLDSIIPGFSNVGLYNITLTFEARIFVVLLAADAPYLLYVTLWNMTFDYGDYSDTPLIDSTETVLNDLTLADFEYTPPLEIQSIIDDYLPSESTINDYDSNTGIILLLNIDSATSGSFVLHTEAIVTVETEFYIEYIWTTFQDDNVDISLGTQQIETLLDLNSIFYYPPDSSATISIIVTDIYVSPTDDLHDSVSRWIGEYATDEYSAGDFDFFYGTPGLQFSFDSFTWEINDANENGISDGMTLNGEITNANDVAYTLGFTIGVTFGDSSIPQIYLATGPYIQVDAFDSVTFSIPIDSSVIAFLQTFLTNGTVISSISLDTTTDVTLFIDEVWIYQSGSDMVIGWTNAPFDWQTDPTDLSNFEIYERANPISAEAPTFFNVDSDTEYEYVSISITVSVTEAGYYSPVVLYWTDDGSSDIAYPVTQQRNYAFYMTEGTHDMDLIIEGSGLQYISGSGGRFGIALIKANDLFDFVDVREGGLGIWMLYFSTNIVTSDVPDTINFPSDFDPWYDPLFDADVTDPLFVSANFEATGTTSGVLTVETFDDTKVTVFIESRAVGDVDGYDTTHYLTLTDLVDGTTYTVTIELLNKDLRVSRRTYQFTFHAKTTTTTVTPPSGGFIPGFEWITVIGGLFSLSIVLVHVKRRRKQ